jgi:predicted DNA-binding transcriptional regulator YafY
VAARKRVTFGYTAADGRDGSREVEPYALYLRDGRWYLVGRDLARDAVRTYTLARMRDVTMNAARPRDPDFQVPAGFDVASYVVLPFQYGAPAFEAVVRFEPDVAWRAFRLTGGQGILIREDDEALTWTVPVADERRFLRWLVENGPGLTLLSPAEVRDRLVDGLRRVVALHGE